MQGFRIEVCAIRPHKCMNLWIEYDSIKHIMLTKCSIDFTM